MKGTFGIVSGIVALGILLLGVGVTASILVRPVSSNLPTWLNYQGRLTTPQGAAIADGQYDAVFRLFDAPTGGNLLWTETAQIAAFDGVFSTTLGQSEAFPSDLFTRRLWLETEVEERVLVPRQELGAVAFAMTAQTAVTAVTAQTAISLPPNTVDSSMIADGAVNSADIADGAVASSKLAPGAVTTDKVARQEWSDWNPTWTSLTVGNGTLSAARYIRVGSVVHGYLKFTLGSTSVVGNNVFFSLPVPAASHVPGNTPIGNAKFGTPPDGFSQFGAVELETSTSAQLLAMRVSGSSVQLVRVTDSSPFTWGSGDYIYVSFTYEGE